MKKLLKFAAIFISAIIGLSSCASTPKGEVEPAYTEASFTKDYEKVARRQYSVKDYLEGNYRSNFKNIPQDDLLDSKEGFSYKVGVFTLDGTKLYLGWNIEGNNLVLCDDNGKEYFGPNFWMKNNGYWKELGGWDELSVFNFEGFTGVGYVFEVEINNKNYVLAIAGRNTDYDGFRMWIEDTLPTDKAESATDSYSLKNYDYIDVLEGVYKPGFKHIWGKSAPEYLDWYNLKDCKVMKYNYNGVDFVVGFNEDCQNSVLTMNKQTLEPATKNFFKIMYGNKEKRTMTAGYCFEGKVKIGDKKVTMAVVQVFGQSRVFIKE